MMKFPSGCGADLPGSSRNKVDKFRINQKKTAPTYCTEALWSEIEKYPIIIKIIKFLAGYLIGLEINIWSLVRTKNTNLQFLNYVFMLLSINILN